MKSGLILIGLSTLFLGALATGAPAQDLTLSLGDDASLSARTLQLIALITVLSLAPGIAIMVTCFPFVVTVLSILRQGIGLQQSPPNMLIVSLALKRSPSPQDRTRRFQFSFQASCSRKSRAPFRSDFWYFYRF